MKLKLPQIAYQNETGHCASNYFILYSFSLQWTDIWIHLTDARLAFAFCSVRLVDKHGLTLLWIYSLWSWGCTLHGWSGRYETEGFPVLKVEVTGAAFRVASRNVKNSLWPCSLLPIGRPSHMGQTWVKQKQRASCKQHIATCLFFTCGPSTCCQMLPWP